MVRGLHYWIFGEFARSLGTFSFYPKVESYCGRQKGCRAFLIPRFRFFFLLSTALRATGTRRAEVPHRPGCGVRLTAPAGVFLGETLGHKRQFVGIDQHQDQLLNAAALA